jgi:IclR family acetate operon transcriptional repressor
MSDAHHVKATETSVPDGERAYLANGVRSLERALAILEELAKPGHSEMGVKELSAQVELPESTTHRLLSVLVRRRYVRRLRGGGRYALGTQITRLSTIALDNWHRDLIRAAHSVLEILAEQSGESTNLVEPVGHVALDQAIYVDQVESTRSVRLFAQIGKRAPLHCTGAGKVLLAHQPKDDIEYFLAHTYLKYYTEHTLTNPEWLRDELGKIASQGYAADSGELEADVHCLAAPVFDDAGTVRAAISISGPAWRFDVTKMDAPAMKAVRDALKQQARMLSQQLGFRPPQATPSRSS